MLVSRSQDDGQTWSAPVLAIEGDGWSFVTECVSGTCTIRDSDPGETLERPTLATAPEACEAGWLYVTANRLAVLQPPEAPPTAILFARSSDGGRHWSERTTLAEGTPGTPGVVVQGGRVAAGAGGEVLVAWYDSGTDGARLGTFEIGTRRSGRHGACWDDSVDAVVNEQELGRNLGPTPTLKSWWTGMFPDVAVDGLGRAHIVYTHDPEPGQTTAEEGDIRYTTSPRHPFCAWSSPVTVNDDGPGRAQGFPVSRRAATGALPDPGGRLGGLPSRPRRQPRLRHLPLAPPAGAVVLVVPQPARDGCVVDPGRGVHGRAHRPRGEPERAHLRRVDRPAGQGVHRRRRRRRLREPDRPLVGRAARDQPHSPAPMHCWVGHSAAGFVL